MKKPVNKFAVLMWVFAIVVAALNALQTWAIAENMRFVAQEAGESYTAIQVILRSISETIAPVILLTGLGALIEIADQIRWNTRSKE